MPPHSTEFFFKTNMSGMTPRLTPSTGWYVLSRAISRCRGSSKHTMQQFIHHWLPTNAHHGRTCRSSTKSCPHCKTEDETNDHFINCPLDFPKWETDIDRIFNSFTKRTTQPLLVLLRRYILHPTRHNDHDDTPIVQLYKLIHE